MPAVVDRATLAPPSALPRAASWRDRVRLRRARRVEAGTGVVVGRGVVFDVARGGRLELDDGAVLGDRCRFHVASGAVVRIGAGAVLGERCAVVAHGAVDIGAHAMLADEVVVIDGRPRFSNVETPVRLQGLAVAPVVVGEGVRVGPGAVVGPGARVGAGAAVAAHAVVEADVAPGAVVDGVPAAVAAVGAAGGPGSRPDARGGMGAPRDH